MLLTVQIAQAKSLQPTIKVIDITVKSSVEPWSIFAPTWELVNEYKTNGNQEVFTERHTRLMRKRFKQNSGPFFEVIKMAWEGDIALACYCPADQFCHRLVLKDILQKIDKQLMYGGELLTKQGSRRYLINKRGGQSMKCYLHTYMICKKKSLIR